MRPLELYSRLDPSALTRSTLHAGHCCTLEEVEGQQTEGCHPPTSFRPPERQKARLDRPTREPANSCRFKEQARGPAGLLGWEEALSMDPVPGLAASPFAIGPGRRDRKQAVVSRGVRTRSSSLDCRLRCATNPGPRPDGRRMEARQQGSALAHRDSLGGQFRTGG